MKWKNNCCLFERFFKIQKNGVFLFGISFSFRFSDIDVKSRRLNCRSGFPVVYARSKTFYLLPFSCSFQTETEFQEWMKEIKQSFQQAQVMMRAGAKIMSSGHRYITQYSKEENGPVTPWSAHSHAHIPSCTYTQKQRSRAWTSLTATGPVP